MNYCPLCGAPDATVANAEVVPMLKDPAERARAWRQHLAYCPGGDAKRSVSVSIPFEVLKPVSPDTNHVTYVNKALGLEYRFYYPDYLDREKCAERIAKVEPYPERIDGAVIGDLQKNELDLQKNELCAALMEWRALVIAKSTREFDYRVHQKLIEDYSRLVQSRWRNRIRNWWKRVWNGQAGRRTA